MVAGTEKCFFPQVKIWEKCQIHPWNYAQDKGRDKFGKQALGPGAVREAAPLITHYQPPKSCSPSPEFRQRD